MSTSVDHVARYYSRKTSALLNKYGPGPRVHFHIGYFDEAGSAPSSGDVEEIRRGLTGAQERLVEVAVDRWRGRAPTGPRVLDMGCGLGGTSLWFAGNLGCEVTAVTCVAEHVGIVRRFAAGAGLANVTARLEDVHDLTTARRYDTAMAWEAACYFDRPRWFGHLRTLLVPGGRVLIEDTFLAPSSRWKSAFDAYWQTDIGSVEDYRRAAQAAGFALLDDFDVTAHTTAFWDWSIAWNQSEETSAPAEEKRLKRSSEAHRRMRTAWRERGIEVRLLAFEMRQR
jgi:tocopherol O-methyltransferase